MVVFLFVSVWFFVLIVLILFEICSGGGVVFFTVILVLKYNCSFFFSVQFNVEDCQLRQWKVITECRGTSFEEKGKLHIPLPQMSRKL